MAKTFFCSGFGTACLVASFAVQAAVASSECRGISKAGYLDVMEAAVKAYTQEHLAAYYAS